MFSKRKKTREDELYDVFCGAIMVISLSYLMYTQNAKGTVILIFLGIIFLVCWLIWYRKWSNKRLLESGIDIVDQMSGKEFEKFIMEHFKKLGYKAWLTTETGDFGADIILEKDGRKIAVQAKRWKKLVGVEAIQQAVGAINHYGAHKAMVITNSSFTENAYDLATSNGVELIGRYGLIDIMSKYNEKEIASRVHIQKEDRVEPQKKETLIMIKYCEKCGKPMKIKNGRYGEFWGCSEYPNCNYTEKC